MRTKKFCIITFLTILIIIIFLGSSVYATNSENSDMAEQELQEKVNEKYVKENENNGIALMSASEVGTTGTTGYIKWAIEEERISSTEKIPVAVIKEYTGNEETVTIPSTLRRKRSV